MKYSFENLRALEMEYGEAYYLLNLGRFRQNYDDFLGAFRRVYPRTQIAYSYKANYTPRLCCAVNTWGGYAEVVSGLEYELAIRVGVDPRGIIFNGPYKRLEELKRALLAGSIVNLDSWYEIDLLESIASERSDFDLSVGLRCNFEVGPNERSRFGFEVTSQDLSKAMNRINEIPNASLVGFHCHFVPKTRSPMAYRNIAEQMLHIVEIVSPPLPIQFIDVGGGFFSRMSPELGKQFGVRIPSFEEYAEAIATPLANCYSNKNGPELILEPGLSLVADSCVFVVRVIDLKTIRGRIMALVSGSVYNIRPTKSHRNLPVTRISDTKTSELRAKGPLDIVGYTCMEDDVLYRGFCGEIAVGDYLVFENVGAYTIVLKPPFIQPSPPVLTYGENNQSISVLKRDERFDDIFATYSL